MSSAETILRASFNRLKARLENSITDSISKTAIFIKDAPHLLKKEWRLLQEEILGEASRIDNKENEDIPLETKPFQNKSSQNSQETIDHLRAKVARMIKKIEGPN